ncbi:helix-turn-helix domain-containing protein [Lentzea aerocolonigenes]|uniref:helix-turn-helix domain-containing protein n=1 Tax=Lentzea aerocolonigenes TaxID=68170 RepID=UPI000695E8B4|nr:helix-turn-helix transcriptional regulator [Lentzea aerocolonigenes]
MAIGSTRGKRRLGRYVRSIIEREGLTQSDVAKRVEPSRQTVMRLMSGDGLPKWATVLEILFAVGASREEILKAQELHAVADVDTNKIPFTSHLSADYLRFRMDETEASEELTLNQLLVPGMLQTAAYAESVALKSAPRLRKPDWAEHAAAERISRQALLHREPEPLVLHALIDEAALRKLVGGPSVMADQLNHLIELSAWPNVTIQVITDELGAYQGAHGSPLTLLRFPETDESDCAYLDGVPRMTIFEEDSQSTDVLSAVWRDVAADALSPDDSVALISEILDRVRKR